MAQNAMDGMRGVRDEAADSFVNYAQRLLPSPWCLGGRIAVIWLVLVCVSLPREWSYLLVSVSSFDILCLRYRFQYVR